MIDDKDWVSIKGDTGRTSSLLIQKDGKIRVVGNLPHGYVFEVTKNKEELIKLLKGERNNG